MNIFIPKKLKIGFQKRGDTYSNLLAYIIYFNEKDILHKERSFNSWIDHDISCKEVENKPISGYVLNKNVTRYSSFSSNGSKFRVYDPRGFEFEISAENFIAITQYSNLNAQEFSGEFVFGWERGDLVLLPTNSQVYKDAQAYSKSLFKGFDRKTMKIGSTYASKTYPALLYLGKKDYIDSKYNYNIRNYEAVESKKDVFFNLKTGRFIALNKSVIISEGVNNTGVELSILEEKYIEAISLVKKMNNLKTLNTFLCDKLALNIKEKVAILNKEKSNLNMTDYFAKINEYLQVLRHKIFQLDKQEFFINSADIVFPSPKLGYSQYAMIMFNPEYHGSKIFLLKDIVHNKDLADVIGIYIDKATAYEELDKFLNKIYQLKQVKKDLGVIDGKKMSCIYYENRQPLFDFSCFFIKDNELAFPYSRIEIED